MSQGADAGLGDFSESVGYLLKVGATALRVAMERELRPLGLGVPQYATLEQLARDPGITGSELARRVFVTRQAMSELLRGLEARGLIVRTPDEAAGKATPARLTPDGSELQRAASAAVSRVEQRMLDGVPDADIRRLTADLRRTIAALQPPPRPAG